MICCLKRNISLKNLKSIKRCFNKISLNYLSTKETTNDYQTNGYEIVEPFEWTHKKRVFRSDIQKPDYCDSGLISNDYNLIKSEEQIKGITTSCKMAKNILTKVGHNLKIGITGEDIDDMVYDLCHSYGCYPSPLNYKGFPKCVTTAVNNVAVHGIPDSRALKNGDIITIDVSIYFKGFHGDCAHTFIIGETDDKARHLLKIAELCLYKGIDVCRDGQKLSKIGTIIESFAKKNGLNVIPSFCGHGIGSNLHEPPQILHYNHNSDQIMHQNMCLTIEPVITEGTEDVVIDDRDGWTVLTEDNCRTAQFEHTILITKYKSIILTQI